MSLRQAVGVLYLIVVTQNRSGFATFADNPVVTSHITDAKLRSIAEARDLICLPAQGVVGGRVASRLGGPAPEVTTRNAKRNRQQRVHYCPDHQCLMVAVQAIRAEGQEREPVMKEQDRDGDR